MFCHSLSFFFKFIPNDFVHLWFSLIHYIVVYMSSPVCFAAPVFYVFFMYLYPVFNFPGWRCCSMQGNLFFKPAWKASSSVGKVLYGGRVTREWRRLYSICAHSLLYYYYDVIFSSVVWRITQTEDRGWDWRIRLGHKDGGSLALHHFCFQWPIKGKGLIRQFERNHDSC